MIFVHLFKVTTEFWPIHCRTDSFLFYINLLDLHVCISINHWWCRWVRVRVYLKFIFLFQWEINSHWYNLPPNPFTYSVCPLFQVKLFLSTVAVIACGPRSRLIFLNQFVKKKLAGKISTTCQQPDLFKREQLLV